MQPPSAHIKPAGGAAAIQPPALIRYHQPQPQRQPWARWPRTLESLPDFCLIHILKQLSLADLYTCSMLNERFAELACSFRADHTLDIARTYRSPSQPYYAHLLYNLGVHINALVLDMHRLPNGGSAEHFHQRPFFDRLAQHVGSRLRHLTIRGTTLGGSSWDEWPALFAQLRTLRLHGCGNGCDYAPIYSADMGWQLYGAEPPPQSALLSCRHLEELSLVWCRRTLHVEQLVELVGHNPRLRTLQLHHYTQYGSAQLVPTIAGRLAEHLQVLSLHYIITQEQPLVGLAELPLLRKLQLVNYYLPTGAGATASQPLEDLLQALRGNQTLRELDLHHCRMSLHSVAGMRTMRALRHLRLRKNYWWTDEGAQQLGEHGELRSIDCYDSLNLSDAGVVAMVEGNARLETLEVSWVPQLTGGLLGRLREVVRRQHEKAVRDWEAASGGGSDNDGGEQLPATARPQRTFRVVLNGRNKIDWVVAKREAQQVAKVGGGFCFQVMTLDLQPIARFDQMLIRRVYNSSPEDMMYGSGDDESDDEMTPKIEFK